MRITSAVLVAFAALAVGGFGGCKSGSSTSWNPLAWSPWASGSADSSASSLASTAPTTPPKPSTMASPAGTAAPSYAPSATAARSGIGAEKETWGGSIDYPATGSGGLSSPALSAPSSPPPHISPQQGHYAETAPTGFGTPTASGDRRPDSRTEPSGGRSPSPQTSYAGAGSPWASWPPPDRPTDEHSEAQWSSAPPPQTGNLPLDSAPTPEYAGGFASGGTTSATPASFQSEDLWGAKPSDSHDEASETSTTTPDQGEDFRPGGTSSFRSPTAAPPAIGPVAQNPYVQGDRESPATSPDIPTRSAAPWGTPPSQPDAEPVYPTTDYPATRF